MAGNSILMLAMMGLAFWQQDWRYSIPTAKPAGLAQPAPGKQLLLAGDRPVLLHFFNPDCPCSKFNLNQVRQLIARYRDQVRFVAVLQGDGGPAALTRSFASLDLGVESVVDDQGEFSGATGVYATPQAVLIDRDGQLYFRGNYNLSRYCTRPETEFVRLALESLLAGRPSPDFAPAATVAYGCPLARARRRGAL